VPLFQESQTIAAIDDMSGALSAQREAVIILAARYRDHFLPEDFDELQRILDACDRIQEYHLIVRGRVSAAYWEEKK
jgi:predicted AAA+ superfamily ATPase